MIQWDDMEMWSDCSYHWRRKSDWCTGLTARRPRLHFGPRELALGLGRLLHFSAFSSFSEWEAGSRCPCSSGDSLLPFFIYPAWKVISESLVFSSEWGGGGATGFWNQLCLCSSLGLTTLTIWWWVDMSITVSLFPPTWRSWWFLLIRLTWGWNLN